MKFSLIKMEKNEHNIGKILVLNVPRMREVRRSNSPEPRLNPEPSDLPSLYMNKATPTTINITDKYLTMLYLFPEFVCLQLEIK
jgi:hypothetical protein